MNPTVYIGVNGNVGIGTATPLALLNAYGGVINDTQAIAATSTDGVLLSDLTTAASGAQKWSPRVHWQGQGWKTNATAASQTVDIIEELQPVQGAANRPGNLVWSEQVNAGGYSVLLTLPTGGGLNLNSGTYQINGTQIACANLSNAASSCSTDATNAGNISSGTLAVARGGTGAGAFHRRRDSDRQHHLGLLIRGRRGDRIGADQRRPEYQPVLQFVADHQRREHHQPECRQYFVGYAGGRTRRHKLQFRQYHLLQ